MSEPVHSLALHTQRAVYVDVMPSENLDVVLSALDEALEAKRRQIWPATVYFRENPSDGISPVEPDVEPRLMLVPLARLGVPQGFSGASVFIGYFVDDKKKYLPSRPVVIKIGKQESLEKELNQAKSWPPHVTGEDRSFAYPFHLSNKGALAVLIAPFSSAENLDKQETGYELKLHDLYKLLTSAPATGAEVTEHLSAVYTLMHGIHRDGLIECKRTRMDYTREYEKYLRRLHNERKSIPLALFGDGEESSLFGLTWTNPAKIVERILSVSLFEGACGPIHGDLHPKNIVLDSQGRPNIIDFGWAQPSGHIVKDYALMEANLRAMTLPSQVKPEDVTALSRMLAPEDAELTGDPAVVERSRLIRDGIWAQLSKGRIVKDWQREYLTPLFLISYGLLKHLDDARNQQALLSTVLCLGERLSQVFPKDPVAETVREAT